MKAADTYNAIATIKKLEEQLKNLDTNATMAVAEMQTNLRRMHHTLIDLANADLNGRKVDTFGNLI